ncbi:unnamed protein product [Phaedon cochleariae]|uniref:Protein twisted gastrulation n=1 Tax=Phaedon cochleariae TaxID=80249 RepID=A0A9P0DRB6_PHACE|nr:unnamed protein product [Phaedon cochleariae]
MRKSLAIPILVGSLVSCLSFLFVSACNEAVCGPVVSKCLLTKSCSCDLKDRVCSSVCFRCLGMLYTECCDCVEMCPKTDGDLERLDKSSYVEDLADPVSGLFQTMIEEPDPAGRWTSEMFLLHINVTKKHTDLVENPSEYEIMAVNCSVLFWSQCMGYRKCRQSCMSIGSSSLRLFHGECCQCVGSNCIDYGIKESRCTQCPLRDGSIGSIPYDENDLSYDDDEYDDVDA